jgi:hypothetical protein
MSPHLSNESLLDLAEGRGSERDRAHAAACAACGGSLSQTAELLAVARGAEVPEPPASYWIALERAVNRRIDEEPRRRAAWGWLVPLVAAAAVVAIALTPVRGPLAPAATPFVAVPSWSALPPIDEDAGVPVLEAVAGEGESGIAALDEGRGLGSFLAGLTDDEAQALAETLRGPRKARKEGEL